MTPADPCPVGKDKDIEYMMESTGKRKRGESHVSKDSLAPRRQRDMKLRILETMAGSDENNFSR